MNAGSLSGRDLLIAGEWHITLVTATAFAVMNGAKTDARTDGDMDWC